MNSNNISLSPYFKLSEFFHTNVPNGIQSNIEHFESDREHILSNLRKLCSCLVQIRNFDASPVVLSSGLRSPMVNAAVGGVKNSRHLDGRAADFVLHNSHKTPEFKLYLDNMVQMKILNYYYINPLKNFCHIQI